MRIHFTKHLNKNQTFQDEAEPTKAEPKEEVKADKDGV